jgi:hypothetical protein
MIAIVTTASEDRDQDRVDVRDGGVDLLETLGVSVRACARRNEKAMQRLTRSRMPIAAR